VIVRTHSFSSDALDPKVKHFSRMNFNLAELEAGDVDPEGWPILTDGRGNITEGVGYNVFIVTGGVIRTAGDRGVLQGVSRAMVFDLARELGIPILEEDLQPYDVYTADEAFFTSTSPCVLPVTRVDRRPIGAGTPARSPGGSSPRGARSSAWTSWRRPSTGRRANSSSPGPAPSPHYSRTGSSEARRPRAIARLTLAFAPLLLDQSGRPRCQARVRGEARSHTRSMIGCRNKATLFDERSGGVLKGLLLWSGGARTRH
jgi:hypothetical protein